MLTADTGLAALRGRAVTLARLVPQQTAQLERRRKELASRARAPWEPEPLAGLAEAEAELARLEAERLALGVDATVLARLTAPLRHQLAAAEAQVQHAEREVASKRASVDVLRRRIREVEAVALTGQRPPAAGA